VVDYVALNEELERAKAEAAAKKPKLDAEAKQGEDA
jgi:hypothetical protein